MKYFIDLEFLEGTQHRYFKKFKIPFSKTKPTIDVISIGIVSENGKSFYKICKEFNVEDAWYRYDLKVNKRYPMGGEYLRVYWIRENVLYPIFWDMLRWKSVEINKTTAPNIWGVVIRDYFTEYGNYENFANDPATAKRLPLFKKLLDEFGYTRDELAMEVSRFMKGLPEIYGYYADYDWVALCWLFGKMKDLPSFMPMYCRDLKQMFDNKVAEFDGIDAEKLLKNHSLYPKNTNEHSAISDALWNAKLYAFLQLDNQTLLRMDDKFRANTALKTNRRAGTTSRIVDQAIQELFNTGKCSYQDHHHSPYASERVREIILQRLFLEHGIKPSGVKIDAVTRTMTLL